MKPDELDSNFSAAKLVIIETKARDTFGLVNVDTATTLRRDAFCFVCFRGFEDLKSVN